MNLRLKYEPTPDNAPRFAADIVKAAGNISGVELDYSVESLEEVDDIIEGFRNEGVTSEQMAETLFGFGCYVGEVFVRNAGGRWQPTAETLTPDVFGFPLVIALGTSRVCNPIGKVLKRMQNGEEDNLPYFYQVFSKEA